jgi:hypothetical protein
VVIDVNVIRLVSETRTSVRVFSNVPCRSARAAASFPLGRIRRVS